VSLGRAPASLPGRTCPPSRQFADIGGEQRLPNCDQFQAGGFLQLSGMRTGQLPWRSLTSRRLVADCQLIDMPLLKGVFVGVSLEVCKVAQANADEFADRLTHSRSGVPRRRYADRHRETKWAAPRIHGSARRQVEAMFQEERPHLLALPLLGMSHFTEEQRTVCDDSCIRVDQVRMPML